MEILKVKIKGIESEIVRWTGENSKAIEMWASGDEGENFATFPDGTAEVWDALQEDWVPMEVGWWVGRNGNGYFVMSDTVYRAEFDAVSRNSV